MRAKFYITPTDKDIYFDFVKVLHDAYDGYEDYIGNFNIPTSFEPDCIELSCMSDIDDEIRSLKLFEGDTFASVLDFMDDNDISFTKLVIIKEEKNE